VNASVKRGGDRERTAGCGARRVYPETSCRGRNDAPPGGLLGLACRGAAERPSGWRVVYEVKEGARRW
jgi:hypothetical protein